jgi:uncharacterized membrane protein YphA (DoxX/SURF4 family)
MNRNILLNFGRILLSILFIFSAISKFISLPFFDGMVAEFLIGPDYFDHPKSMFWSQVFTRVLITAELVLGLAVLQNKWFKRLVMPALMLTLILFTAHLFIDSIGKPNGFIEGNCGCFGDVLPMNNLESILKNVAAILIGIFVWRRYNTKATFASWVSPVIVGAVSLFTLSFGIKSYESPETTPAITIATDTSLTSVEIINPQEELILGSEAPSGDELPPTLIVEPEVQKPTEKIEDTKPAQNGTTSSLLLKYAPEINSFNHQTGTKLVCLFSMTCSHCQEVYKDICSFSSSENLPPIYLVNFGSSYEQNYFFSQAGDCMHPHSLVEDYTNFKRMLEGETYPRLLVYKNGEIAKSWNVDSYTKEDFQSYFSIEEIKEEDNGGLNLIKKESPW